jgi:hypothetical protein
VTPAAASGDDRSERRKHLSPLELFHPDGVVEGVAVGGEAAPVSIEPQVGATHGELDLVFLAPSASQGGEAWLEGMLDAFLPRLSRDGVLYLLVPRAGRHAARRRLRSRGLELGPVVAHVPSATSSRYLVPLDRSRAAAAFSRVVAVWPRRRRLLAFLARLPGATAALEGLSPAVALVARKPGARPLFLWASASTQVEGPPRVEVLVTSGRAENDRVVLVLAGSRRGSDSVVAKIRAAGASGLEREAAALGGIGATARAAGAAVPVAIGLRVLGRRRILLETALPGKSAAALLASRPGALTRVLCQLCDWLDDWHRATLATPTDGLQELEQRIIGPAESLAPLLEDGGRYVSWLRERCAAVGSGAVPLVATHNDLTMFNVLVTRDGIGVVDWEEANGRGLALTDFFYAAADAAAAATRYLDRLEAFDACFSPSGRHFETIAQMQSRLATAARMTPQLTELAFHACWLGHAVNEQRSDRPQARPFISIVQRLATSADGWLAAADS